MSEVPLSSSAAVQRADGSQEGVYYISSRRMVIDDAGIDMADGSAETAKITAHVAERAVVNNSAEEAERGAAYDSHAAGALMHGMVYAEYQPGYAEQE